MKILDACCGSKTLKKKYAIKGTIAIFLLVVYISLNVFIYITNERYINTQGSNLMHAYEKIERLEQDLAEEKEPRQVANWKLGQIESRSEGIRYQEGEE